MSFTANKQSLGKFIVTPAEFDPKRIVVEPKPSYSDGTNGDSYTVKYDYVDSAGKTKREYLHTVAPTMSLVYGSTQREPDNGGIIKADTKYGFTLGCRVVCDAPLRKPKVHEDEQGNFVKWEEFPRVFRMQDGPTGNAFRGDDKVMSPEHQTLILAYYKMISEIESEIRSQLASILNKTGKSLSFSDKNMLIRPSSKTPYQDIHAKVCQFKDKSTGVPQNVLRVTTNPDGTGSVPFDEFVSKSGGARVAAWLTFPSVHLSTLGNPTVRCTADRVLCKGLGVDPNASRVSDVIDLGDVPDTEEIDPELLHRAVSEPSPKRARLEQEQQDEDANVFAGIM